MKFSIFSSTTRLALCATLFSLGACSTASQTAETQAAATSAAQTAAQTTASSLTNGLTGALGIPNLTSTPISNLTGVLSYCNQTNMTSNSSVSNLISTASQKPGITSTADYRYGQQGILQAISNQNGNTQQYSLSSLAEPLRQKVCSVVANRLQSLL